MRLIMRVFFSMFVCLTLVVFIARMGDPDCVVLTDNMLFRVFDLRTARIYTRPPQSYNYDRSFYATSPDDLYQSYFERRRLADGNVTAVTYDFYIAALNSTGVAGNTARLGYADLPAPFDNGGNYARIVVDAVWLPDSRHVVLYWMPDYYRFHAGITIPYARVTQSVHKFVIIDVDGNIIAQRTLTLSFVPTNHTSDGKLSLHYFLLEGIASGSKVAAFRHVEGINSSIELWSLSDFQPVAAPITVYAPRCQLPIIYGEYCLNWSPNHDAFAMHGVQIDGSMNFVIQDFTTGLRHAVVPPPLPPSSPITMSRWSPDGLYLPLSWYENDRSFQLLVDRDGNTLYAHLADSQSPTPLPDSMINKGMFGGQPWHGSQLALVWNDNDVQTQTRDVKIGVFNATTGLLTELYTFHNQALSMYEPLWIQWLSDTRLAVATDFAFVWGNIDGTDWRQPTSELTVYQHTFTPDNKSVLAIKRSEDIHTIYNLDLETGILHRVLSSTDPLLAMNSLHRSPAARYVYRLIVTSAGRFLQVADIIANHTYMLESVTDPFWTLDDQHFVLGESNKQGQSLRVFSSPTGEFLKQSVRTPSMGDMTNVHAEFGRCN